MSPRTTDVVAPGNNLRAASTPLRAHSHQAPSSTATDRANGATTTPLSKPRKAKPLSSGWKSLAWTKPPVADRRMPAAPHNCPAVASSPMEQQWASSPGLRNPQKTNVHDPADMESTIKRVLESLDPAGGDETKPRRRHHSNRRTKRSISTGYLADIADSANARTSQRGTILAEVATTSSVQERHSALDTMNEEPTRGRDRQAIALGGLAPPAKHPVESDDVLRRAVRSLDGIGDYISSSTPTQHRRKLSTDPPTNVVLERSLSDTSIVTASDFGASKSNKPTILTDMTDEDAGAELIALLAKGKGLPVVKHSTGLGGGKSRKLLRFNETERCLSLCSMLPPYFKTKIPVQDIDRVDAKWCCVVVHAEGRSPIRLEVDSLGTADILRVGLMAASRTEPVQPVLEQPPPPPLAQQARPDPEQGLSSVRPGHKSSHVYDPDAALSVAALLAKEMEDERSAAPPDGVSISARSAPRTGTAGEVGFTPVLKRSASMTSVASLRIVDNGAEAGVINNRRSLPRDGYGSVQAGSYGRAIDAALDTKAALRRFYSAIDGRGMVAIKRNPNGKGRSRVMVRSRTKEGTIGWAHVLPPFSRKFIPTKDLVGASRSSRVVTVNFKGREPVLFETDRLTDALILEQGFLSLAILKKNGKTHF